ncbi:nucleoside phosphorylase domain-containing protein [Lasiosphaeria miniovina]|uniref:Nucleoside phosphorylase domain-containing protein n=1 Tax=Lasiosphaeria miniovina TaxID=1954250 RepID=A0AA40A600_9PEZI|nr:nucleoside phosphorylase domain-containing protein [Lasiosphaeria miniovina]KAK0709916.1 nucleoside phosphorylase domain-containing protein [Lasiosphaeria miniovina]
MANARLWGLSTTRLCLRILTLTGSSIPRCVDAHDDDPAADVAHFDPPLTLQFPAAMPTPPFRRGNSAKERPAGRHGFEIAIFCALPLESSALSYLFDEFFDDGDGDPYQKVEGDLNHYTTGRIGRHNVVLVLLPGMGKALAASAAASLRASYPNVRVALVVGICGGVPGPLGNGDDIFLGDVVISNSIVQYDLGSQYPNGVFARKKKPAKYKYPGTDEDELFRADYRHRHRFSPCCNQETTCDKAIDASCDKLGCEDRCLVDRDGLAEKRRLEEENPAKAQEPAIYIGPVASGDTVMKSGEDRDRIAREEGILAFEMEGAGVWDEIPCIVVKSVCDYADSHKRKQWQEFAAAAAASAAKALLEALVVADRKDGLVSRREMLAVLELFRRQGRIPLGDSSHDFGELVQFAIPNRPVSEVQFHSVLVIDARGRLLPFHLETINSKELFVHILRARFKDLGHTKIDRGEWSLEGTQTGEILDLDKPWQTVVKHKQVIRMSMDFRRRNVPTTDSVCGLTYCRIEETQEIEVRDEAPNSAPTAAEPRHDRPPELPRPRPPIQVPADQDIRHYKQVRIIDTSFRIQEADGSEVSASRATFSTHHLNDTRLLASELAKRYGLPEEDL